MTKRVSCQGEGLEKTPPMAIKVGSTMKCLVKNEFWLAYNSKKSLSN